MSARAIFIYSAVSIVILVAILGSFWPDAWYSMIVFAPLILVGVRDMLQKKHTIKRNFPLIGNFRYMLEAIRPELMQYFVETDTEGKPFNRLHRSMVYRRAKKVNDSTPFGTQMNVYAAGYEWMDHSIYAKPSKYYQKQPRVLVGGPDCTQPYFASLLNVSAMSYGALSNAAVTALNLGAKKNKFAHNTGEGGLSEYHLQGGDVIWQIGTGYFGARDLEGNFSDSEFQKRATLPQVKMIEIKISQGAKPGHGGLLPAAKNTPEIAKIRGVEPFKDVHSPSSHSAFSNPNELLLFVQKLRTLSGGKPVGFKLCVGKKKEFTDICQAMLETGIKPDFITVDGGEGGTGAAPMEFSNSMGMPMRDALAFVSNILVGLDLKKDIKLIASGKVITGFDIARAIAIGADMVNCARGMMMALGCIQALQCNTNTCPVGVATQDKRLIKGLDVGDKSERVANFHEATLKSFVELTTATGIENPENLRREHINRRISQASVMKYSEIFPYIERGSLLNKENLEAYLKRM